MCVVAGVQLPRVQRSVRTDSRPHCQTQGICHFYTHCLETEFPCGKDGFVISYARERCRVINRLRASRVSYMSRMWARGTEFCFQEKLLALLSKYPQRNPDPQTCLAWEQDAIAELNSCYSQENLKKELLQLPEKDVTKIIELFRVGGTYYNATVDTGLIKVYGDKAPGLTVSLQSTATTSTQNRIILCILASKYPNQGEDYDLTPEEIIDVVSYKLDINGRRNFHYAGPDQFDDLDTPSGLCFNRSNDLNAHTNDYHLVTWFLPTGSTRNVIGNTPIMYTTPRISINAIVFELTSTDTNVHYMREQTRCGDGIRQVSEECDFGSNYPSCTIECRVREGHDCTTEKLTPSTCWMEECGDGLRTLAEECDDGNMIDGDGCSASCKIEHTTHTCTDHYNSTSDCTMRAVVQVPLQVPAKLLTSRSTGKVSAKQSSSSASGETIKRTVEPASSGCRGIRYSLWWLAGLLFLTVLTLR